jgi:hypothetical protein
MPIHKEHTRWVELCETFFCGFALCKLQVSVFLEIIEDHLFCNNSIAQGEQSKHDAWACGFSDKILVRQK